MKTDRIKRAANFFLIMFFLVLFFAIIQAVQLIKAEQFTFMVFLQLVFMLVPYIVMWGFADATYEALNYRHISREDAEVLKHYTDGPR